MQVGIEQAGTVSVVETISPQVAEQYLTRNTNNRKVKRDRVSTLASDIATGRWEVNGETIKFDIDGNLIDGQHRLLAAIKAKRAIQTFVVRGLPRKAQDTVDAGAQRSAGDVLAIHGALHTNTLAATVRVVSAYDNQLLPALDKLTNAEVLDKATTQYPDLAASVAWAVSTPVKSTDLLTGTYFAAAHYLLSRVNREQAEQFLNQLVSGAGLVDGTPLHQLRRKLETARVGAQKYPNVTKLAWVLKTWNAVRQNGTFVRLTYKAREEFPVAV